MQARAALASVLAVALVLSGCAQPERTIASHPAVSTPSPAPPSPHPTLTKPPKPPLRPLPAKLPAGLRRNTGERPVVLTFDDGPSPAWTPKVLDQLRAAKVTATFCVVGREVQRHPELVRRIVLEGHQLCNHSWRHDLDLARRPVDEIQADLARTNKAIQTAVPGAKVPFYRQPGGRWTSEVLKVAKGLGMRPLHWSVDPQDWDKPTAATIGERIHAAARPGAIVLLHDGGGNRAATLAACPHLIADLKKRFGIAKLR
ncbi:polysaccharide deacetylase family protein [Micromonospora sp. WMMD1155]|uniref:polysaccharide deacetylase family protein n=1 Tax=Micromonospora sp. WMMD1155 TaxID=3016094 RepID=UPI00249C0FAE|nr:polysaccharide deacetylase family protein [Micromonospora sp. WMMD1155]WFE50821.1 polysaccharide deacetylase family protein [Micromonospora sp. WMMD1155]